ncbi:MAG: heat-shock protein [Arenimonas sp. SCN 70-307]|uniref:Do family serine endopeptidase n=3 Tax=unclassified Arenimonas TaxID=2641713 RepID=UPI00086CF07F|nr:Do family serine endopeptidase [Arenimonas sp. SCN 70-307]ODS61814.1 MAG: heat-shock protein [Arenimonas sp. SCN 70-307]
MRPIPALAALLLAALAGAGASQWLAAPAAPEPVASQPSRGERALETAASLALPRAAHAALPAQVDGAALPSLAPMLEQVTPAVVNIYSRQVVSVRNPLAELFGMPGMPQQRSQQSLGSGVIVDAERGLVLTNHHVIENADEVSVTLSDGRTFEAEFIGSDPDTDVAVIRIPAEDLVAIAVADSSRLRVGDFVVAVGNPFGLGQTVTSGIVSAVGRSGLQGLGYQNFIQTDASINPGNSGGALVNLRGELVGINTASFNPRGSAAGNIGLGFAIPANLAEEVKRQLLAYGEVRRGTLGLDSEDLGPRLASQLGLPANQRGAVVTRVYRGSPAETAGVRPGDLVVAINGERVDGAQALRNAEGLLPVDRQVRLDLLRDERRLSVQAVLKARATEVEGRTLDARLAGATLAELPERFRQRGWFGVVASKVEPGSRADRSGLRAGDYIRGVNRRRVDDLQAFQDVMAEPPRNLQLDVVRGNRTGYLVME